MSNEGEKIWEITIQRCYFNKWGNILYFICNLGYVWANIFLLIAIVLYQFKNNRNLNRLVWAVKEDLMRGLNTWRNKPQHTDAENHIKIQYCHKTVLQHSSQWPNKPRDIVLKGDKSHYKQLWHTVYYNILPSLCGHTPFSTHLLQHAHTVCHTKQSVPWDRSGSSGMQNVRWWIGMSDGHNRGRVLNWLTDPSF